MSAVHILRLARARCNVNTWASQIVSLLTTVPVCHAEQPEVAPVAVPALAQLFRGLPSQASAVDQKAQHSPGAESGAEPASSAIDTAALQLEALQVLLLLFPLPFPQVSPRTQAMLAWVAYTNAASPLLFLA